MHFNYNNVVDWLWYNNEISNLVSYKTLENENILKQLECTYQSVIEFPCEDGRFQKNNLDEIRLFNSSQLTELSQCVHTQLNKPFIPYLLRFMFDDNTMNITNIEQIAVANSDDHYPKNVKRRVNGINCVFGQQTKLCDIGNLMIHLTKQSIDVCIKFEENTQEGIEKTVHFSCIIPVNDEKKLVRLLGYWRKDNLFYIDMNNGNIQQTPTSFHDRIAPQLSIINQNDEIQCTFCNYYYSQRNNEILSNYINDEIQTYEILKNNSKCVLTSEVWDILDELDEKCESNVSVEDSKQNVWFDYWMENHSPHNFDQKLFEAVCLTKVQEIISMLKLHPNNNPIIVALSNENLYEDFFRSKVIVNSYESKSLSHIFDTNGNIKKIDSKGNIYNILIPNFDKEILYSDYFHKFIQISSKLYINTMIIFTRTNKPKNIYIAYNGYIRLLSLELNNEDLHYFLPQFIPLSKGLFIDLEFSVCDCGTIINYNYLKEEKDIIYQVRCHTNVIYLLNYYQLLNKTDPDIYYESNRKSLVEKYFVRDNNIKLWKTLPPKQNPVDMTHPFHSMFLSIIESAKQCIASIQSNNNISTDEFGMINDQLQQSGVILLFHRTFFKENNEQVEQYKKENDEMYENNQETKPNMCNDLSKLINYLQNEKCINNVNKYTHPIELTYDNLCTNFSSILEHVGINNKVLVFKVIEHQREELIEIKKDEQATDDEYEPEDEDDHFQIYEADDGKIKEVHQYDIIATSTFECVMEYEFEMISDVIHTNILSVEDIMKQLIPQQWTTEHHKLLTQFYEFDVYNQYDLNNKILINKMKNHLMEQKQIYKKFSAFIQQFNDTNFNTNWLQQRAIHTVEVARNAKCLQKYIDEYKSSKNIQLIHNLSTDENDENELANNTTDNNNTLIIAYNPLQTVIIQSNMIQDVCHAVHLYRSAVEEQFYPIHMLSTIYTEWMEIFDPYEYEKYKFEHDHEERHKTVIDCLAAVLNYNIYYDIILVPSWINLDKSFLSLECEIVAVHPEAIQKWEILFLYKGIFYIFDESKHNERYEIKTDNDNREKIYIDNVKLVLRQLCDNFDQNASDVLEPNMEIFDEYKKDINDYQLRNQIKKTNSNISFKWLTIGCGECHLHEMNGSMTRIEPNQNEIINDYQAAFAKELQNNMFVNYMDCRIPFNSNIISHDKRCAICRDLQVKPSIIGHNECKHSFCFRCIEQWKQMRENKINEQYRYNAVGNDENDDNSYPKCPLCQRKIIKISVDKQKEIAMKQNIPITIYQQILDENEGRNMRLHAIDNYNDELQKQKRYEEAMENRPLEDLDNDNPEMEYN